MNVHRDLSDILNKIVLRDIIQIHGTGIPYPAELWVNGTCQHGHGTAMFSFGETDYLTVEYFAYDPHGPSGLPGIGFDQIDAKLVMKDTQVEIPVTWINSSPKARTWHSVPMPSVEAYECDIFGQLGDHKSQMNSISITVVGLPNLRLGQVTSPISEESTAAENLTLHGFKKQMGLLHIEAGEWKIELTSSPTDDGAEYQPLHHVDISRKDNSPFTLEEGIDKSIIIALRQFLSFQCGRWIGMPTIICNPVYSTTQKRLDLQGDGVSEDVLKAVRKFQASDDPWRRLEELGRALKETREFEDVSDAQISSVSTLDGKLTIGFYRGEPTKRLAWVEKLVSSHKYSRNSETATEIMYWPKLFAKFWELWRDEKESDHLRNVVQHYIEAQRAIDDNSVSQALVATQSTLQGLTRWWNNLRLSAQFGRDTKENFRSLAAKAVQKAELGKDDGLTINMNELEAIIKIANDYRNDIDHGRGITIEKEMERVSLCRAHHHNLTRLLILAKLGNRSRNARGYMAGPYFSEEET